MGFHHFASAKFYVFRMRQAGLDQGYSADQTMPKTDFCVIKLGWKLFITKSESLHKIINYKKICLNRSIYAENSVSTFPIFKARL